MPGPNGEPGDMSAGGSAVMVLPHPGTIGAVRVDQRRDRLDRRQLHMVIGVHEFLVGGGQFRATGAALGLDIARHVWVGTRARVLRGGAPSWPTRPRPWHSVAQWRRRRVRRRLRRLADAAPSSATRTCNSPDPRQHCLVLLDEIAGLPALSASIPSGRYPELESAGSGALNAASLSPGAAGVSSYHAGPLVA
jgi:hypothetical protein